MGHSTRAEICHHILLMSMYSWPAERSNIGDVINNIIARSLDMNEVRLLDSLLL